MEIPTKEEIAKAGAKFNENYCEKCKSYDQCRKLPFQMVVCAMKYIEYLRRKKHE